MRAPLPLFESPFRAVAPHYALVERLRRSRGIRRIPPPAPGWDRLF